MTARDANLRHEIARLQDELAALERRGGQCRFADKIETVQLCLLSFGCGVALGVLFILF